MTNCIKKSAPGIIDDILAKYSDYFFQYETARILAIDPAMKNMGVTSFIVDVNEMGDILEAKSVNKNKLDTIVENTLSPEYISRVDLGVKLEGSYLDTINVVAATNQFLETLVTEILTTPVGTTLILIEKQPETNTATCRIFETVLAFFCKPCYRNILIKKPKVTENILFEDVPEVPDSATLGETPVTPLGYTAVIPVEGYGKNSIGLYSGVVDRSAEKGTKYLQNKTDTASLFRKFCTNKAIPVSSKCKIDDMADSFCMTVFAISKLVSCY